MKHIRPNRRAFVMASVLFWAGHTYAQDEEVFFNTAQSIYANKVTAPLLLGYLLSATPDEQKDFRYFMFRAKADYAVTKWDDGDSCVESAMKVAQEKGVDEDHIAYWREELANQKNYWITVSVPSPTPIDQSRPVTTLFGVSHANTSATETVHSGGKIISRVPQDKGL